MYILLSKKDIIKSGDYMLSIKFKWVKIDKGMSIIGKPCGLYRIIKRYKKGFYV